MVDERHERLIAVLREAASPVSGAVLSAHLRVSTRSVRQYVRDINEDTGAIVIESSGRGYTVRPEALRAVAAGPSSAPRTDTPMQRLYYIARRLVTNPEGEDVFRLAEMLSVSEATVEADLAKVRAMVREVGLTLRRDRDTVRIEGREIDQRRLVRRLLLGSADGVAAAGVTASLREYQRYDMASLTEILDAALRDNGLSVHGYALGDLTLHLVIALDRMATGHEQDDRPAATADPRVVATVDQLAASVEGEYGITIAPAERSGLVRLIGARFTRGPGPSDDGYLPLIRRIIADIADQYLLEIDDDSFAVNLSLHVANLVARARRGERARNPLRVSFKQSHPLVHELAVFVASRIEQGTGIEVTEDEIVYLSLHLGTYLQRAREANDGVTITCVVPRYYEVHTDFVDQLQKHLGDAATIKEAVHAPHHDWGTVDSDLVVSTIDVPPGVTQDVVLVPPVLSRTELDRVSEAVRAVRSRKSVGRIRWTLSELLDPRLFRRVRSITQEEALEVMCADLVAEGVARPGFLADVRTRERLSSTAFGGTIAVPHSLHLDCHRTAISVLISDEPIAWGESSVHLVALFALSPTGRHLFRDTLDEFIATLADPVRNAELVTRGTDYGAFINAVTVSAVR